jgi:trehalose 6-phosphate synthase
LAGDIDTVADRINARFKTKDWKPIVVLKKQHSHHDILPYYRAADICLVTSLHDGMNLVAKEYVAARTEDDGVLILSRFTGASRELRDALIVNPYDIDQTADAIRFALQMDENERVARMQRMRQAIHENNIYRWGANLITELAQIRPRPIAPVGI